VNPLYSNPQDLPPPPPVEGPPLGTPALRMVPIRQPARRPLVAYSLIGLTIFVYLLQLFSQFVASADIPAALGMKVNELIVRGELWRLFTPMLLHGSLLHLAFNMYALNIFGPGLERHYGRWRFLALYLLAGFAGNVVSFLFSTVPSLGSSTAIFGLLGAEAVFLYQNRGLLGRPAQRALINLITVALVNLLIGLSGGIDNWGHVGGLLGGTLFAWFGGPLLQLEGIYPAMSVADRREASAVFLVAVGEGLIFATLAGAAIYLRGGY